MLDIYNHATRKKVAVLDNAMQAVEVEKLNGVSELSFSMPSHDVKNEHCAPFNLVRWGNGTYYRLLDHTTEDGQDNTGTIAYTAEHVIATLIDDVIFGTLQIDNWSTPDVIRKILSLQTTKNWVLGDCEIVKQFSYNWSNENLLVALFSVPNLFVEEYKWVFDTSVYPWTIHLKKLDQAVPPKFYIRDGKNLLSTSRTSKARDVCTRLYALGYGEGINQLNFAKINGGKAYIDAEPEVVAQYGIISRIWEDSRFEDAAALLERAKVILKGYSHPYESFVVSVADIEKLSGETMDRAEAGKIVSFDGYKTYITQVERRLQEVGSDAIELANAPEDIVSSIADLADRQRINSVYAQGSTCLYSQSYGDNADQTHPAVIKFYVPQEARQVNKVMLKWELDKFRTYSIGAASGGGVTTRSNDEQTTKAGGDDTTSADKIENVTTPNGGGKTSELNSASTTTGSSGFKNVGTGKPYWSPEDPKGKDHYHTVPSSVLLDHSHSVPRHTHDVPNHNHKFNIPSHSHKTKLHDHKISGHTHDLPTHTHKIEYGIYEGPKASSVTLQVGDNNVPLSGETEMDITQYLVDPGTGKIARGRFHTIKLTPNSLTRITATLSVQLFIQSVGGGNY